MPLIRVSEVTSVCKNSSLFSRVTSDEEAGLSPHSDPITVLEQKRSIDRVFAKYCKRYSKDCKWPLKVLAAGQREIKFEQVIRTIIS